MHYIFLFIDIFSCKLRQVLNADDSIQPITWGIQLSKGG